jgi:hypothetical protein
MLDPCRCPTELLLNRGKRQRWCVRLGFRYLLLCYDLAFVKEIAGIDLAVEIDVFLLPDALAILVDGPDINATVPVGVCFLPHCLSIFVEYPKVKVAVAIRIPFLSDQPVILEEMEDIELPTSLSVEKPFSQLAVGKKFDQVRPTPAVGILFSPYQHLTLEKEDPVGLSVSVQILFLPEQATFPVGAPQIYLPGMFAVNLFLHQLAALEIGKTIHFAVRVGILFDPTDLFFLKVYDAVHLAVAPAGNLLHP